MGGEEVDDDGSGEEGREGGNFIEANRPHQRKKKMAIIRGREQFNEGFNEDPILNTKK